MGQRSTMGEQIWMFGFNLCVVPPITVSEFMKNRSSWCWAFEDLRNAMRNVSNCGRLMGIQKNK